MKLRLGGAKMVIGNREFNFNKDAYIMGILNVTPDSFSDGNKWNSVEKAKRLIEKYDVEGVDIIDIGGESTRPGYKQISCEEEIERILPIIEYIKKNYNIPVSVDTYKSEVALEAVKHKVDMINDIWGLKYDKEMGNTIAQYGVACCLMHNRKNKIYNDLVKEIILDLEDSIAIALRSGISKDKLLIDPGIGFGKKYEDNLKIMNKLEELKILNLPILLGTSRKSIIGETLKLPSDERIEGTIATTIIGLMKGATVFRVHDVKENKRAIEMAKAILYF